MDVGDLLRRLRRRRRLVVVVVLVAVLAAGISWGTATSTSQSGAAVVIVPPTLGTAVSDQNPLLNLDSNLSDLAVVLSAAMNSADAAMDLRARKATDSFTISTVTGDNPSFAQLSPQLVFRVTGPSGPGVERTATALVAVARSRLTALQADANVPMSSRASLVEVVAPTSAESIGGGRLRAAGSIGLAIVVLGLIAILVWDEFRLRRFESGARGFRPSRRPRRRGASSRTSGYTDGDPAPDAFRSR